MLDDPRSSAVRGELRRPVAAAPQAGRGGPRQGPVPRLRRLVAGRDAARDRAVSSRTSSGTIAACWNCSTPTTRSSTRPLAQPLRDRGRQGRGVPAGDPGRPAAGRRADAGERPDADVQPEPDLAGEARAVDLAADPRDAAPAAAARRPQARREPARPPRPPRSASGWSSTGPSRNAPRAISRWTRSASPWRTYDAVGPLEDHGRRLPDRPVRRADRRAQVRRRRRVEATPRDHRRPRNSRGLSSRTC